MKKKLRLILLSVVIMATLSGCSLEEKVDEDNQNIISLQIKSQG